MWGCVIAAGVEMVPGESNRTGKATVSHKPVDCAGEPGALPVAEPAAARRQSLRSHVFGGERDPGFHLGPEGHLDHEAVELGKVRKLSAQSDPAERPDAPAEQRPQVPLREPVDREGVARLQPLGLHPQVVAILEDDRTRALSGSASPPPAAPSIVGPCPRRRPGPAGAARATVRASSRQGSSRRRRRGRR